MRKRESFGWIISLTLVIGLCLASQMLLVGVAPDTSAGCVPDITIKVTQAPTIVPPYTPCPVQL